jgi:hypothetical protein
MILTNHSLYLGVMVMPRTPIPRNPADEDEDISADGLPMDASLLPPG